MQSTQRGHVVGKYRERLYGYLLILPFIGVSFYFHEIGVAPLPLVASLAAMAYLFFLPEPRSMATAELMGRYRWGFLGLCLLCLYSFYVSFVQSLVLSLDLRVQSAIGMVLGFLSFAAINVWERNNRDGFDQVVRAFLVLVLVFFYIQFIAFAFFGTEVDFLVAVTGEEQRIQSHEKEIAGFGSLRRTAGAFAEPAVHSYYVVTMLCVLLYRRTCSTFLFLAGVASVALSFSVSGMVLLVFPLLVAVRKAPRIAIVCGLVVLLLALYYADMIGAIFETEMQRLENPVDDESGADRLRFLSDMMTDGLRFLFGYGVLADAREFLPPSGFVGSAIYVFGFFGSVVVCAIFYFAMRGRLTLVGGFLVVCLGLILNFSITSVFFWSIFSILAAGLADGEQDG